jgi:hypothetical protein
MLLCLRRCRLHPSRCCSYEIRLLAETASQQSWHQVPRFHCCAPSVVPTRDHYETPLSLPPLPIKRICPKSIKTVLQQHTCFWYQHRQISQLYLDALCFVFCFAVAEVYSMKLQCLTQFWHRSKHIFATGADTESLDDESFEILSG